MTLCINGRVITRPRPKPTQPQYIGATPEGSGWWKVWIDWVTADGEVQTHGWEMVRA